MWVLQVEVNLSVSMLEVACRTWCVFCTVKCGDKFARASITDNSAGVLLHPRNFRTHQELLNEFGHVRRHAGFYFDESEQKDRLLQWT